MNDLFMEGLHITALGLGVVFVGLSLLTVLLMIINLLLKTDNEERRPTPAEGVSPGEASLEGTESDIAKEELVAAVLACLSCVGMGSDRIS